MGVKKYLQNMIDRSPSIVLSTQIKNPRLRNVELNSKRDPSEITGTFSIDVTNTGVLSTTATRVTQASIELMKENSSLSVIELEKPIPIETIEPSETRTVDIEFSGSGSFVDNIVNDVCEENKVNTYILFTVSEVILAATYENTTELDVSVSECIIGSGVTIANISTADTIQTNQDSTFSVTGNNISEVDTIRWDMGDGTILEGQQVEHRYATSGDYTVRVDLLVDEESIDTETEDITVETFAL